VVEQVTGAEVTRTDDSRAPAGSVDARLKYPDGRIGALEFSTLGLPSEFELEARIKRLDGRLPMPGRWKWVVALSDPNELPRIQATYAKAILACEAHGIADLQELPQAEVSRDPDLIWLRAISTSRLFGIKLPADAQDASRYVDLTYRPVIAGWQSAPGQIVAGLNAALAVDPLARRVDKLARADGDERHLFLRVTFSGLDGSAMVRLVQHSIAPDDVEPIHGEPDLPMGIDHLWLLTGWGQRVTRWRREAGWDHPRLE
jgi:hypothetical protein